MRGETLIVRKSENRFHTGSFFGQIKRDTVAKFVNAVLAASLGMSSSSHVAWGQPLRLPQPPASPAATPQPAVTPASTQTVAPQPPTATALPTGAEPAATPAPGISTPQVSQSLGGAPSTALPVEVIDAILVSVESDIILLSDLQKAVLVASNGETRLTGAGKLVGGSIMPTDSQQILDSLIDQKILTLRLRDLGLNVSDDELESEITGFLKNQNVTREQLEQKLKEENETYEEYREEFRKQLETQRFIGRTIKPLVTVTEDELRSFYLQQQGAGGAKSDRIKLRSLYINFPPDITEAQKRAKLTAIANIQKEVAGGGDFGNLVKLYSESPDALQTGGQLPPRTSQQLPNELREKLTGLKPGSVVGPLNIGSSVFFFQYQGQELNSMDAFQKQRPDLERRLQDQKFQQRLQEYLKAERSKVKIKIREFPITRA